MTRLQCCKRCRRTQYVVWRVSDDLWNDVCRRVGWPVNATLCLECFAELAGHIVFEQPLDIYVVRKPLWNHD